MLNRLRISNLTTNLPNLPHFFPPAPNPPALRNPGMKDRHWDNLSTGLGMEVRPKETLNTLKDVYPLVTFKDKIVKTCEVAAKEWDIESRCGPRWGKWKLTAHTVARLGTFPDDFGVSPHFCEFWSPLLSSTQFRHGFFLIPPKRRSHP